ncbi:BTAD domain-containing putative transcriptional regulator [Kribbella steppae]|uniref:BTAD domain-containing putative transcriptional regulator n=1 Tax=Kribbella steppae TaxID=2512223 RepID=UPI0010505174|nr:BTAD domain-containing putative transcriptional regulator [Kribbella steppae]
MPGTLAIHLLGEPHVSSGEEPRPAPRGRKGWALLAYLLTTASAPSREWLAELLFSDADDPFNALSWNLSQLRRLLGPKATISGGPVELRLPPGSFVDVRALTTGTWVQALGVPGLGRELLEGMTFPSSPAFEAWLLAERRRLSAAAENALREAARAKLAAGDAERAVELAIRVVAASPFDEDAQELLIRAYAAAGDRAAARRQRDSCIALFRRELGTDPGQAVLDAADPSPLPDAREQPPTIASVTAGLETGLAAMDAGAVDAAVAALRRAVAEAHQIDDPAIQTKALVALGSALVHGVRGRDGEGAGVLLEAIEVAHRIDDDTLAAQAHRELGYVELLRGRYDRAQRWLHGAVSLAGNDPAELAWAHAIQGVALTDVGRHADALYELGEALRVAQAADVGSVETWALTFIGRIRLLRRELVLARKALEAALARARQLRWTAFIPLPESLLADVDLAEGYIDAAASAYDHAYALSLQLGDPCWEGLAARGKGLVANRRGDTESAMRWVTEARMRCIRLPDAWLWVEGYCLDALCELAIERHRGDATQWAADLEVLATRTGMRELVARAYLHRSRSGDRAAAEAAAVLAAEVDNPAVLRTD